MVRCGAVKDWILFWQGAFCRHVLRYYESFSPSLSHIVETFQARPTGSKQNDLERKYRFIGKLNDPVRTTLREVNLISSSRTWGDPACDSGVERQLRSQP
jgi:hypothetical protein